jgi:type II secretory pathway component PulM
MAPPAGLDARADLERVLAQQNLRALLTQQDWKDGRARLTFGAVQYDALIAALEALQRDARLRIVEATLTARIEPGTVRAELVLAR